jgi:hypothetical protein
MDAMEALTGSKAEESKEVPSRRSSLRLEIRGVLLEHHREDAQHGLVISRRGPLLLERGHLFVAGWAELHEVPPTDLGKNPRRQLSASDGTQKLAGDMDIGHFSSLARGAYTT